jgi:hypothetical protein
MKTSKFYMYIAVTLLGLLGMVAGAFAGAFAGGFIAAARCEWGLECLGAAILGVGLGAILAESLAMSLAAHRANRKRGSLPITFITTIALAVPIPFTLLLAPTMVLAAPLFLLQVWACVKVQLATGKRKRMPGK